MENNLNEPSVSTEIGSSNTEPTVDDTGVQPTDVWAEDFDTSGEVPTEAKESEDEPVVDDVQPEYRTEGLGDLDAPLVVKRKGKLYDLTNLDEIRNLVEKGLDSTIKNQELADLRRELAKEQNPDITDEELSNVDTVNEIESIAQEISSSSYVDDFKSIVETLPNSVVDQLRSDPKMLRGFSVDMKSGFAQKIMPIADRYMNIDGLSFQEAYMKAGSEVMDKQDVKSDRITKLTSQPGTVDNVQVKQKDVWSMSDDEYKSLMSSERR